MITKSQPAHTLLPGLMLAACVALPGGAAAQTPPPTTGTGRAQHRDGGSAS